VTTVAAPRTRKRAVIIVAAASTCATSVAAQDVYIVPRHEESHAAARQQALLNEQMRLMEAQRKVLGSGARQQWYASTDATMDAGHGARPSRRVLFWWKGGEGCAEVR